MNLANWIELVGLVGALIAGLLGLLYGNLRKRLDILENKVSQLERDTASFATTTSVSDSIDKLRNQLLEHQSRSESRVMDAMRDLRGYLDVRITDLVERLAK